LPYRFLERSEDGTVRDITEELPFEIPDGWEWVRLGMVVQLISGQDMTPGKYNTGEQGIPYLTGASNIENGMLIINRWTTEPRAIAEHGDLLITCKGTVGTMAFLQHDKAHIARQIMSIKAISLLNKKYLHYFLESYVFTLKTIAKSMIPGIAREDILRALLPLPPLAEQHRIVKRIKELLPYIEQYDIAEKKLTALDASFPKHLKKSILQEAVQGKLVSQNLNDEPASVLLKRIRVEKKQLEKEKKIRKDKHKSIIFRRHNSHYEIRDGIERCIDEEIPFEIPDGWEWVRLGMVFNLQAGKFVQAKDIHEYGNSRFPCYGGNGLRGYVDCYSHDGAYPLIGRQGALCGNINFATGKFYATEHAIVINYYCDVDVYWIGYFLSALNLNQYSTATAQPGLAVSNINNVLIPLPPLAEQHRIVKRIDELAAEIGKME
jgi:type I restriction enzyme S subunit